MGKKTALAILTVMAVLLCVAAVPASAETEIDQSQEVRTSSVGIGEAGGYQTVQTGKTGTLDKVELLVACCGGTGSPTGDLKVTIATGAWSPGDPGSGDAVAWVPKEEFTADDEQAFRWVTATLGLPLPVQSASVRPLKIYVSDPNPSSGHYLWADSRPGSYNLGKFYWCYMGGFPGALHPVCGEEWQGDMAFRTHVTVGPDTVDPDTTNLDSPFLRPGGTLYTHNSARFTFASDERGVSFDCSMDGGAWELCTSPEDYTGLSNGSHTLRVRAFDAAGNYDETPASFQFFVQFDPPDTFIDSTPSNPSGDPTPTFEFSSDVAGASHECRISRGTPAGYWNYCTSPYTHEKLTESGEYTLEVKANKFASFGIIEDPSPATYTWSYEEDTVAPPAPVIVSPAGGAIDTDGEFTVSGTAEASSTVELFEGPDALGTVTAGANGEWSKSLTGVAEGVHTYTAKARDEADNISGPSNTLTVEVITSVLRPTVEAYTPVQRTGVPKSAEPTATFSTGMEESTITPATVSLQIYNKRRGKWIGVAHAVSYDAPARTVVVTPGSALAALKKYRVTVTPGVQSSTGVALDQDATTPGNQPKRWTFTTGR